MGLRVDVFGYDEQSGRVFVDTVHESQAGVVGVVIRQVAEVVGQGVDQRAGVVAVSRMDNKTRRLIDHQQVLVLINDIEGNILRDDFEGVPRTRHDDRDHVARLHPVVVLYRHPVHSHVACIGSQLDAVAARMWQTVGQKLVDADRCLLFIGRKTEMFVCL